MTIRRVDYATGVDTNDGSTWALAYKTLGAAIAASVTAGDEVWLASTSSEQLATDVTYTIAAVHVPDNPLKVLSVDVATNAYAEGAVVGSQAVSRLISIVAAAPNCAAVFSGVTFRIPGTGTSSAIFRIALAGATSFFAVFDKCSIELISSGGASLQIGNPASNSPPEVSFFRCAFTITRTSFCTTSSSIKYVGCTFAADTPCDTGFFRSNRSYATHSLVGCELQGIGVIANSTHGYFVSVNLAQCSLRSDVTFFQAGAVGIGDVQMFDCAVDSVYQKFAFASLAGSIGVDSGVYAEDTIANQSSWSISTTSLVSRYTPFKTPWISAYHDGITPITPYLEMIRVGSSTPLTNADVWAEWMYKGTAGSARATVDHDKAVTDGTPEDQQSSTKTFEDWVGANASSWLGKIGPSSPITPVEPGDLSFRICVGAPNTTVYVDPQIRGLS